MEPFNIGQRVQLSRKHPWGPAIGTVIRLELIEPLGEIVPRVRLENGREVLVTSPGQMKAAR